MNPRLIAAGTRVIDWLEKVRLRVQPRVDNLLERMAVAEKEREQQGFAADTDFAILQQEPLRARILLRSIGVAFTIALMWSAVSRIDEVTRGEARVVPTSQLQGVQSVEGGVVEEIAVREGQIVADTTPSDLLESTGTHDPEAAFLAIIAARSENPAHAPRHGGGDPR